MARSTAILFAMLASTLAGFIAAAAPASPRTSDAAQASQIVRDGKSHRQPLAPARASAASATVHAIEVDPRLGTLVLRDSAGRVLFVNDERQATTIVARDAVLPDLTLQSVPTPPAPAITPHPPAPQGPVELRFAKMVD